MKEKMKRGAKALYFKPLNVTTFPKKSLNSFDFLSFYVSLTAVADKCFSGLPDAIYPAKISTNANFGEQLFPKRP